MAPINQVPKEADGEFTYPTAYILASNDFSPVPTEVQERLVTENKGRFLKIMRLQGWYLWALVEYG